MSATAELKRLQRKLQNLVDQKDEFMSGTTNYLAMMLLANVKERTPVGQGSFKYEGKYTKGKHKGQPKLTRIGQGGVLRRAWLITGITKAGDVWTTNVQNNIEYASYVEFGHRQTKGRFVPVLGKRLVNSWVEGRHMLRDSVALVRDVTNDVVQRRLNDYLKE